MHQIYFAHANGFPAETYECLFRHIPDAKVDFIPVLGRAKNPDKTIITQIADEIVRDMQKRYSGPVIGLGHSAGAMALLIAHGKQPELFSKLILMEPTFFHSLKRKGIDTLRFLGLIDQVPVVKRAERRKEHFPSLADAKNYFLQRQFFRRFHPDCFDAYLKYGLVTNEDNSVQLRISAAEEAHIFRSVHTKIPAHMDRLKAWFLYGSNTKMLNSMDLYWWKKRFPHLPMIVIEKGSHVFPMEYPLETAKVINQLLNQ